MQEARGLAHENEVVVDSESGDEGVLDGAHKFVELGRKV
jgi:hypothetical protein